MKIEFGQVLYTMNGEPIQEGDPREQKETRDLTLGRAAINSLLADVEGERQTGAQKFDRFKLAMRIGNEEDPIEITIGDASLIKERVGIVYPTYAVGLIWTMLEGNDS